MVGITQINAGSSAQGEAAVKKASVADRQAAVRTQKAEKERAAAVAKEAAAKQQQARTRSASKSLILEGNLVLNINFDDAAGRFVYRGLDPDTGEVVRQFPADQMLNLIKRSREQVKGFLVDESA